MNDETEFEIDWATEEFADQIDHFFSEAVMRTADRAVWVAVGEAVDRIDAVAEAVGGERWERL